MAAKDYTVHEGVAGLYLVKNGTSRDKRRITDNEILSMTEWYLRRELAKHPDEDTICIGNNGEVIMELKLIQK